MLIEQDKRLSDLLEDAFADIASSISDILDKEFNKRKEDDLHPRFFNAGYKYTDFLGRILSNEFGELSESDVKLADKIIDREFKKFTGPEVFTARSYAMEYGSNWHGSVKEARMHVLHYWKQKLIATYMYYDDPELYDIPITPVDMKPTTCPYCGGKVVKICYGEPTEETMRKADKGEVVLGSCLLGPESPDWQCINCGCEFRKEK